eukprot:TRINITY_DN3159_c4_g1_i3.p1 TRINITY_DN3159_c4_g1~~TRINITY_DN3159_c4_g1_i3.p1  ORF type:complete len:54 (+),score=8.55 TRINITY_DN3159_c4_g1_i3:39-200(+)
MAAYKTFNKKRRMAKLRRTNRRAPTWLYYTTDANNRSLRSSSKRNWRRNSLKL